MAPTRVGTTGGLSREKASETAHHYRDPTVAISSSYGRPRGRNLANYTARKGRARSMSKAYEEIAAAIRMPTMHNNWYPDRRWKTVIGV
jgi:hypothetical protein